MPMKNTLALVAATALMASPVPAQDAAGAEPARILIYSGSNAWGWVPTEAGFPTVRLPDDRRFGGVLQDALGDGHEVVVDGLNNRTTDLDDPQNLGNVPRRAFNGAAELPETIARELPLDLVVVMLGTTTPRYSSTDPPRRRLGLLRSSRTARAWRLGTPGPKCWSSRPRPSAR